MADGFVFSRMAKNNNNLFVARDLASSVKTLLGPLHSLKCCLSDDEAVICSSTSKLLQFTDIQHPAGFIINDACQGQYKKYRTNCKTLVCLAGFWSTAVHDLQDQGVPIPVIVHLLDDALEVCERVCQEMSIPVLEASQGHQISNSAPNDDDVAAVAEGKGSNVGSSCGPGEKSEMLEGVDVDNDSGDENDISWYFNGRIPGVDDQILGVDPQITGVNRHISGVDGHILGGVDHILGVQAHLAGTDVNIPGETDMGLIKKSCLTVELPHSDIMEMKSFDKEISRDLCSADSSETPRMVLSEYGKFVVDLGDTIARIKSTLSPWVNARIPGAFPNAPTKTPLLVEHKDRDLKLSSPMKEVTCNADYVPNSPSESSDFTSGTLSLRTDHKNDDEDEFEASFEEVVHNSVNEDLERNIAELTVQNEKNGKFPSEVSGKRSTETCQKPNCSKLENTEVESSHIMNKKLMNLLSLSSFHCKENEESEKSLSLLTAKLENKSKGFRRQVKMAEIFKGSRHFMQRSTDELLSGDISATIVNPPTNISFDGKRHVKSTTSAKTKSSLQSMCTAGQAGKPDLANSAPRYRKAGKKHLKQHNQNSSTVVPKQMDELKFNDTCKQLLSKLGKRLSHGKEKEMQLAIDVVNSILLSLGKTSLEELEIPLRMIHTELVQGPPSSFSQRMDGLLLECTTSCNTALRSRRSLPDSQVFVALVNGDVTKEFRHVGLNKEYPVHRIIENGDEFKASLFNERKDWHQRVTKTLHKHKIGLLIVKGIVQDSVLDFCSSHGIAVLQSIAYPALQLLSYATASTVVTYLADLREQDIGRPISMETWDLGWAPSLVRRSKSKAGDGHEAKGIKACQYVLVKEVHDDRESWEDSCSPLQTVLLCSPSKDVLCDMEERFWNSIHRLKNTFSCGRVLPGAGAIEIACIQRLNELAGEQREPNLSLNPLSGWLQESLEIFRPVVYTAFAQGFKEFLGNVLYNSGEFAALCGVSTRVEQLVKSGCSLGNLGSFKYECSEDDQSELQITAGTTLYHATAHVSDIPARNAASFSVDNFQERATSKRLSSDAENDVWDDYTAKKEAWRRAVGIVRILLQSDMLVETGLTRSDKEAVLF